MKCPIIMFKIQLTFPSLFKWDYKLQNYRRSTLCPYCNL